MAAQQQTANDLKEESERSKLGLPEKYSAKEYLAPFVGYKDYEQIKNIVDTKLTDIWCSHGLVYSLETMLEPFESTWGNILKMAVHNN